jgi:hypothetical protein
MTIITALANNVPVREAKYKVVLLSDSDKEVPVITLVLQRKSFLEWLSLFKKKISKTKGMTMEFSGAVVYDMQHTDHSVVLHTA